MSTTTFPRLFPAADAGYVSLPAAVQEARRAYDRICTEAYTEPETHYDVLDRVVAETVTAVQAGTPLPGCGAVDDARRAEQVATDQAEVLRMAVETLAVRVRSSVDANEVMTEHLQPAHAAVVKALASALAVVAEHHNTGQSVLLASAKVRAAEASIDELVERYTAIRTARVDLDITCSYAPALDVDGEFSEIRNPETVWTRTEHRNFNAGTPPWPRTPTRARLAWFLAHGCEVWLPSPTEQDGRFSAVYATQIEAAEHQRHMGAAVGVG